VDDKGAEEWTPGDPTDTFKKLRGSAKEDDIMFYLPYFVNQNIKKKLQLEAKLLVKDLKKEVFFLLRQYDVGTAKHSLL